MKKTRFDDTPCPIARSLGRVGEWWSILILRDAFHGLSKFDEFQQSLGLSPTLLTRRLKFLVESGILYKQRYQIRPVRYEYLLTERGKDFFPVLVTLFHWGNTHLADDGVSAELVDLRSGKPIRPQLIDTVTQQPVSLQHITLAAGPAAGEGMRLRALRMQQHSASSIASSKESL
ncbi:transcriptional regulator [Chania multitudinisentens RB-25]|uniref:Transcriptional regulator n=1 Tax=Chania multitudinisentens RB-25 TaxID=1441930 RepID=W0LHU4_9GAMM|nr:winged helix-turn-helix transcriptional regulator [Chania multitudinisentens]AHG22004.1 transcriptional regulator [Chania multitudinisentens RB-25]